MTNEHNPHHYSTVDNDETSIAQITDDTDFPHTGLIKALSLGVRGNYVIKGSATDFDITQASSGNVVVVKSGKIFRDGALHTINNGNDTNFTASDFNAVANNHHLLVAQASDNTLQIRKFGSSTPNKIPSYDDGDTIIAIITYTTGFNAMNVQFLTTSKVANNVSIGYGTSAYTEAMSISASAGDTTIENKVSDKDIIFKVNDGGASSESMRIDGDINQVKIKSLGIGTAAELTITESSDDITIKNTVSNKDINFNVNDGGSDTEVIKIDGASSSVRIGQSTASATDGPDAKLDVRGANDNSISIMGSGALSIENSAEQISPSSRAYAFLSVDNGRSMIGGNIRLDDSITGGTHAGFADGTNQRGGAGIIFSNSSTSNDGDIQFVRQNDSNDDTWTVKESMRIDASGNVGIGTASPDANAKLSVEGAISLDEISAPTNTASRGQLYTNADNHLHFINGAGTDVKVTEEVFIVALSDETTDLTTGTAKASFHMPFAMTLTGVKANCTTAPVGSTIIVDINEAGSTILSTKLSIDASETTSTSAASAAVISDTALANDALITFDIDQIGSSTAGKGLKVTLYGVRA